MFQKLCGFLRLNQCQVGVHFMRRFLADEPPTVLVTVLCRQKDVASHVKMQAD